MKTPKKTKPVDAHHARHGRGFSVKARMGSFAYAFRGLWLLISREHNAWIHFAASVLVISAALFFEITEFEWCAVVFAVGLVWTAEALNTAIEYLADALCPEKNELIGGAKDLAAAGVLLAALTALVIGLLIFGPYVTDWLEKL